MQHLSPSEVDSARMENWPHERLHNCGRGGNEDTLFVFSLIKFTYSFLKDKNTEVVNSILNSYQGSSTPKFRKRAHSVLDRGLSNGQEKRKALQS